MEHPGETAVQERLGVALKPWGSAQVGAAIPAVAARFLGDQSMAIIGARDDAGSMWATVLAGPPGFLHVEHGATVVADALPGELDPLAGAFEQQRVLGMLVIDLGTRRRMRVNGRARRVGEALAIDPDQVYANCPKYIQLREETDGAAPTRPTVSVTERLSPAQQRLVARADTLFIATQADPQGADVSHRGGLPGFVTATADTLSWPEYTGNKMYMTLGNLELDGRAALLFIDWDTGGVLHLTGRARPDWDTQRAGGALATVDFGIERVVAVEHRLPLRWSFGGYSKFNPAVG
ncbi:pyridoxamine 5'-phosphate oxidase family protein [Mycolicibacterium sp.]|uniref:pyridoxamine 5'-phosphate oxidase family protein n=1 Tax=Mycolicibacterium sp. TaxID=2320850 RepID=UPI003D12F813